MAQPANDNCANAESIAVAANGFGTGIFTSSLVDMSAATVQPGEVFSPSILSSGLNRRSVWFKFTIASTRSVTVNLQQPASVIQAGNVGFTVWKTSACMPSATQVSNKLTPIETFGKTFHPCVELGEYYVQVSANNNANGSIFITVEVADPENAPFDKPANAHQFPAFGNNRRLATDFEVGCQGIDSPDEICLPGTSFRDFNKSTWHTFTTPAYFDYMAVLLSENFAPWNAPEYTVGYRLYEGDVRSVSPASLIQVSGCDSFRTNGHYPDRKVFNCNELKPSTTYTIQLIYHKDFGRTMRLAVARDGFQPANGPRPDNALRPVNRLGVLNSSRTGINNFGRDTLGCNSRHAPGCGPAIPDSFFKSPASGIRYNHSVFFSFTLATYSSVRFWGIGGCQSSRNYIRIFRQSLPNNCTQLDTANIVGAFEYSSILSCMEPGDYVAQVMFSDSLLPIRSFNYNSISTSTSPLCLKFDLGRPVYLQLQVSSELEGNRFGMRVPGAVNKINTDGAGVMQPLVLNQQYIAAQDTFGCANTVLPNDPAICNYNGTTQKASYRTFVVQDSAILYHSNVSPYQFKVYRGDIDLLATAQSKFLPTDRVDGLVPISRCSWYTQLAYRNNCVTPGTYTIANFGNSNMLGSLVNHRVTIRKVTSRFKNPAQPEDLGSILDTVQMRGTNNIVSQTDTFNCINNAVTIDGLAPCNDVNNAPATKALYRQFFLSGAARITISLTSGSFGNLRLFRGKVSEVGTAGLRAMGAPWNCFSSASTGSNVCDGLDEGWYTLVAYSSGGSFETPLGPSPNNEEGTSLGNPNRVSITITPACARPRFNRPFKASVAASSQPHNVDWVAQTGHSQAYPNYSTRHTLPTENFDCSVDTPFATHPLLACNPTATGNNRPVKVAYWVWEITRPSYIQITIPDNMFGLVYNFDVRTDSARMLTATPVQPCQNQSGNIQLCKMQPGVYTLVVQGLASMNCTAVAPAFYVDNVGFSRFDHAFNAYDFGPLVPDRNFYLGKPGDTNPLHTGRAPSNDFFYCTTGAQERDPTNAVCYKILSPEIYSPANNVALLPDFNRRVNNWETLRRNLWYTFVANDPGTITIRVDNKTAGKMLQYPFAVYRSDEDGTLDFATLQQQGRVDSTLLQGLTFVANNFTGYYCYANPSITIFNEPCNFRPVRYYILVENRNGYATAGGIHAMNPNSQVEVALRMDSVQVVQPKFDHYSTAGNMGIVGVGRHRGETDNITCATRRLSDPVNGTLNACQKNLWYRFTSNVTGTIRYRVQYNTINYNSNNHIQLFRQVIPGDSTSTGLSFLPGAGTISSGGFVWQQRCISPGTYYLLLPGCNAVNEVVFPEIEILEQAGDFCSAPMATQLNGPGTRVLPVLVDCHTIGNDYGEFNQSLTCPAGGETRNFKSTWYRLDIGGTDTLDVTVYIDEKTNALPADIKYRMMTGNCGAMQEQSCVQDALTRNTYRCLAPGNSYFIQVLTPLNLPRSPFSAVTGTIDLNVDAIKNAAVCNPASNCIAVANFDPRFDCTTDRNATFLNYSTFGTNISYEWNFGYNNATSTEVSPQFFYPALTRDSTYTVMLVVSNNACGRRDTAYRTIFIPARPAVNLGPDITNCINGTQVNLDATSHAGSTYRWSNGRLTPTATFSATGSYWAQVTYNNCIARDTITIWNNPIAQRPLVQTTLCNTTTVTLNANRGQGEQYTWSDGSSLNNIIVAIPGVYWADLYLNGCTIRDSFRVFTNTVRPLGPDTALCTRTFPFTASAATPGATNFRWQNNSANATFTINAPGTYWVDITLAGCTFRDSLVVTSDNPVRDSIAAIVCSGSFYTLPSGRQLTTSGVYRDTLRRANGCDSILLTLNLEVIQRQVRTVSVSICQGESYEWQPGVFISQPGTYRDTLRSILGCDSLVNTLILTRQQVEERAVPITICAGQSYTSPLGRIFNFPGTYRDTIRSVSGCDSIIFVIDLRLNQPLLQNRSAIICAGLSFTLPSGRRVNTAGLFADTVRGAGGCDSLITSYTISVQSAQLRNISASICQGAAYTLPSGRVVTSAGQYRDTLRSALGCDSVLTVVQLSVTALAVQNRSATICAGGSFALPGGRTVSSAGTYRDTLRNTTGCDSIIFVTQLTVQQAVLQTLNASICAGAAFTLPSGRAVSTAGTYLDTLRTTRGCDSIRYTISLQVNTAQQLSANRQLCSGQVFTLPVSGRRVTAAGLYADTLRSSLGCDSLITNYTIVVQSAQVRSQSAAICQGAAYTLPSGRVVTSAGQYRDTLRSTLGCDSVLTVVQLSVTAPVVQNRTATMCAGGSFTLPGGRTVSSAGTYRDTLRNTTGCDSIIFITLVTVQQAVLQTLNASICAGAAYRTPSGRLVGTSGTYSDTLRSAQGCDSVRYTISLQVNTAQQLSANRQLCSGQVFTLPVSGRRITAAGLYADTLRSSLGCDSIITSYNITVQTVQVRNLTASICQGSAYTLPSGRVVTSAGQYRDTLRSTLGCDSVLTVVQLSVTALAVQNRSATICAGGSFTLPGGRTVSSAGTYRDTLRNTTGCDSIVFVTQLTVQQAVLQTLNASICAGAAYRMPSGRLVGTGGTYRDTLRSTQGCDSVRYTINLQVNSAQQLSANRQLCSGQVFTLPLSGRRVSVAGLYADTLRSSLGCDSIITSYNITVQTVQVRNLTASICQGAVYTLPSGRVVTSAGQYRDTLRSTLGCDSVVTVVQLSVTAPTSRVLTTTICNGAVYRLPSGRTVASTGTYLDTLRTIAGCDSIRFTVQVTAGQIAVTRIQDTICRGESYILPRGRIVTQPGVYLDTLPASNGICDSVIITTIAQHPPLAVVLQAPQAVCPGGVATISANASGGNGGPYSYTWSVSPSGNSSIQLTVNQNTPVTVTVTDGCTALPASANSTIRLSPLPVVILPSDTLVAPGSSFTIRPVYRGGVSQWLWAPAAALSCSNCANPVVTVREPILLTVQVSNNAGCIVTDSFAIRLSCRADQVFLPNTFTPNGDGMNDIWYPRGSTFSRIRFLRVFNRWGQLVFERINFNAEDRSAGWDGKFKGVLLTPDVFVYSMGIICSDGQLIETKGNVMIVR